MRLWRWIRNANQDRLAFIMFNPTKQRRMTLEPKFCAFNDHDSIGLRSKQCSKKRIEFIDICFPCSHRDLLLIDQTMSTPNNVAKQFFGNHRIVHFQTRNCSRPKTSNRSCIEHINFSTDRWRWRNTHAIRLQNCTEILARRVWIWQVRIVERKIRSTCHKWRRQSIHPNWIDLLICQIDFVTTICRQWHQENNILIPYRNCGCGDLLWRFPPRSFKFVRLNLRCFSSNSSTITKSKNDRCGP